MTTRRQHLLIAACCAVICVPLNAATYYATGESSTNWSVPQAWYGGEVPNGPGTEVWFTNWSAGRTYTIDAMVTVGVLYAETTASAPTTLGASTNGWLVLTNNAGNAMIVGVTNTASQTIWFACTTEVLQPVDIISSGRLVRFDGNLVGAAPINAISAAGGVLFSRNPSPGYTGVINCWGPSIEFREHAMSNATHIILNGARLTKLNTAFSFFRAPVTIRGGATINSVGAGVSNRYAFFNTVTLESGSLTHTYGSVGGVVWYEGDFTGTGTVLFSTAAGSSNYWHGSISPGLPTGTLTLNEANGTLFIGEAADPVALRVPLGDQSGSLELLNMNATVDLANIDLVLTGMTPVDTTNWFLSSSSGFLNEFRSIIGTNGDERFFGRSDDGLRMGIVSAPEPAVATVGVAVLLTGAAWRARRAKAVAS